MNFVLFKFVFATAVLDLNFSEVFVWTTWFSIVGFLNILAFLGRERFDFVRNPAPLSLRGVTDPLCPHFLGCSTPGTLSRARSTCNCFRCWDSWCCATSACSGCATKRTLSSAGTSPSFWVWTYVIPSPAAPRL